MRSALAAIGFTAAIFAPTPAAAVTIFILHDPMTMERRTVVVDEKGPDRAFLCMLPPAVSGCQAVPLARR